MELLAGCYTQCFSIVFYVLINSKSPGALDDDNCEGRPGKCCEGFMLDKTLNVCVECSVGYLGQNCSKPCPFNSYGKRCQMICNCNKDECDFIRGCEKKEFGNETTDEVSEATTERTGRKAKISIRNLLIYVLVGLSSLVGFVCIMHIVLHHYKIK